MTSPDHDRLVAAETRLAALEARIAELERAAAKQMPWDWLYPSTAPVLPSSSDDARCAVCHSRYADMGLYVCNHPGCPSRVTYTAGTHPDGAPVGQTPAHLVGTTAAPLP